MAINFIKISSSINAECGPIPNVTRFMETEQQGTETGLSSEESLSPPLVFRPDSSIWNLWRLSREFLIVGEPVAAVASLVILFDSKFVRAATILRECAITRVRVTIVNV